MLRGTLHALGLGEKARALDAISFHFQVSSAPSTPRGHSKRAVERVGEEIGAREAGTAGRPGAYRKIMKDNERDRKGEVRCATWLKRAQVGQSCDLRPPGGAHAPLCARVLVMNTGCPLC